MRPNYKALAKKYKQEYAIIHDILQEGLASFRADEERIKAKEREADEWKRKYTEAMDKLIEMQERIWMQGEANDG